MHPKQQPTEFGVAHFRLSNVLRQLNEEPIRHLLDVASRGGINGEDPRVTIWAHIVVGSGTALADLDDDEARKAVLEFKRVMLGIEQTPGEIDAIERFGSDIRLEHTIDNNPKCAEIARWCDHALGEFELGAEVAPVREALVRG